MPNRFPATVGVAITFTLIVFAPSGKAQSPAPAVLSASILKAAADAPVAAASATHPLIIRIPQSALEPKAIQQVDRRAPIQRKVLGADVVGESHTTGQVTSRTTTDQKNVAFLVTFQGRTTTRTTGYEGPAIIHSHTITDFICTRRISFDPHVGFSGAPCSVAATTTLEYDGFDATRRGLVGAIVRRVAARRAGESHAAALEIAERDNETELSQKFDAALDEHLAKMTERMNMTRLVKSLFGDKVKLQLAASSEPDCINFGLAREGATSEMPKLPPLRKTDGGLEAWVHPSLFGPLAASVVKNVNLLEAGAKRIVDKAVLWKALAVAPEEAEKLWEVSAADDWIVISLGGGHPQHVAATSAK